MIYSVSFRRICSISRWFFVCLCEKCFTLLATGTKTEHAQCVCFSVYAASQHDAQIESYESFWFGLFFRTYFHGNTTTNLWCERASVVEWFECANGYAYLIVSIIWWQWIHTYRVHKSWSNWLVSHRSIGFHVLSAVCVCFGCRRRRSNRRRNSFNSFLIGFLLK